MNNNKNLINLINEVKSLQKDIVHGKDKESEYKKIRDGSLITCHNRTFIDAICANRNHHMAYTYIEMGNHDPRLYTTCLVYGDDDSENVLNLIHSSFEYRTGELYKKFINEIFLLVDQEFLSVREDKRKKVLLHLKESLQVTRIPNNYNVSIDLNTYTWSKELKKLKKEKEDLDALREQVKAEKKKVNS